MPIMVRRAAFSIAAFLPALGVATTALAQAQTPPLSAIGAQGGPLPANVQPTPQQLNPAQNAPAPSTKPRGGDDDLFAAPEAGPCPLASSSLRFVLKEVRFDGADKIRPRDLEAAYRSQMGREIGLGGVCEIRDRVATILFRQGVLARVEIPEQRIENGILKLDVIEAHVVSVRVRGDGGPAQEKVEEFVGKLRGMKPFDIKKAQRYLLLASDIPGLRISASLRRAEGGPGAVDLIVSVSRKPVDALVNIQNYGSEQLGRFGGVARVDLNGFTRYGERTSFILFDTLEATRQTVAQVLNEARFGAEGLTSKVSVSYALSAPGGDLAPLHLAGQSLVVDTGLYYPLLRARRTKLNVGGGFNLVDQNTKFGTGGTLSEDHLRVFYLHADGEQRWRPLIGGFLPGVVAGDIDLRRGVEGIGSSLVGGKNLSRIDGRSDGFVVRGDVRFDLNLFPKLNVHAAVTGQYSAMPLLAYEQFAVGTLTVGRGYDPSSLTGDSAVAGTFEARLGPFDAPRVLRLLPPNINASVFAYYDVASVFNHSAGADDRTVHSIGGGASMQLTNRVRLDVTYAHPMDPTSLYASKVQDSRVLVSITTSIL